MNKVYDLNEIIKQSRTKPFEGLAETERFITTALQSLKGHQEKLKKNDLPLHQQNVAREKARVRVGVQSYIEYITSMILQYGIDQTGFKNDPVGILNVENGEQTLWSSAKILQTYPDAILVEEYAKEILAEKRQGATQPLTDSEAARLMGSQEEVVNTKLSDESEVIFDKKNNRVGFVLANKAVRWMKIKFDMARNWVSFFVQYLLTLGIKIKDWVVDKTRKVYQFACS